MRWAKRQPEPPTGVRIVYDDGLEEPCKVEYRGRVAGIDEWVIVEPVWNPRVSHIHMDTMPGRSSIRFEVIRS